MVPGAYGHRVSLKGYHYEGALQLQVDVGDDRVEDDRVELDIVAMAVVVGEHSPHSCGHCAAEPAASQTPETMVQKSASGCLVPQSGVVGGLDGDGALRKARVENRPQARWG